MEKEDVAIEMVAVSGRGAKENGFFAQKSGSGVLHSAVGKARDHHHVVLGKGKRLREETGQIVDSLGSDLLHFGGFFLCFPKFRLADIESGQARSFMHSAEGAGGESKKIGADGTGLGKDCCALAGASRRLRRDRRVGNDGPVFRSGEFQMEAAFQIGLIETGKGHLRIHGDKERVEVLGVVIFVFKASDGFSGWGNGGGEIDDNDILTGMNHVCRQLDVAVVYFYGNSDTVDGGIRRSSLAEVEQNGAGKTGAEAELFVTRDGRRVRGDREAKLVANVGNLSGALASKVTRDSVRQLCRHRIAGGYEPENSSKVPAHRVRNLHEGWTAGKA